MRHTRTKQLIRLTGSKYWEHMSNARIDEMRGLRSDYELDKTFKWHRLFNQVSYKERYRGLESYVLIGLYSKRTSRLVDSR